MLDIKPPFDTIEIVLCPISNYRGCFPFEVHLILLILTEIGNEGSVSKAFGPTVMITSRLKWWDSGLERGVG